MCKLGVIFTDTAVLADKYNCRRHEVIDVINNYIDGCRDHGIDWQLVDVGGHDFDYIFNEDVSWQGYCRALADNCAGMGWQTDSNTPLLIIGGDDVIPVPIVLFQEPGVRELTPLQADTLFCYPPGFDIHQELARFHENGYNKGELYEYFISRAVFNVSRLPLENGDVEFNFQHDLGGYLKRSMDSSGTITVNNMLPVSAFQWYFSTQKTVEYMPLLPLGPNNGCHMGDIFVSPLLRIDNHNTDNTAMAEYISALGKADMLMFNLHGSNHPEITGFIGEGNVPIGTDENNEPIFEHPLAFDISLLPRCNARILNTEACFGARYINYPRWQSMLLSSLYNGGVLLYVGSCVSSCFDQPILSPDVDVSSLRLTNQADRWISYYLDQQMQGVPAGLAMLKSKWLYYDEIGNEKDWRTPLTLLEFNQFGDPTLTVRAPRYNRIHAQQSTKSIFHRGTEKVMPFKEKFVPIYSNTVLPGLDAAYADVRKSVDIAFMTLSEDLRRMLADDYHYPSKHLYLSSIMREESSGGFLYVYAHMGYSDSERTVYVRVDSDGKVKKITYRM